MANSSGGFGTRIYFIPNNGSDPKSAQVLKGSGYVTINLKGAHYRSEGNLWQQIFGGSDQVVLSTQVTRTSGSSSVASQSIEEMREIKTGTPYYFGSGRAIALNIPADCDSIDIAVTMSAVKNDRLGGALNILNSGELKETLQMTPAGVSSAIAVAGIVKKLLSNTDPQSTLQGDYAGRLSTAPSDDPVRDFCLVEGTIILLYRESADDTTLDDLDPAKLTTDGDGLKYAGAAIQNTYAMFQISYEELRGEDPAAQWHSIFSTADQILDGVVTAASDAEKQNLWTSAYATYQQAAKLLLSDPTYTMYEATGLAATHLKSLQTKYLASNGAANQPKLAAPMPDSDLEKTALEYLDRLKRSKVALPGPLRN
jgi:hypothetical protein